MVVDFDGRIMAQAESGPGERIVVGPIDIESLRIERRRRRGHDMLSHLRTELYQGYRDPVYPKAATTEHWPLSIEGNNRLIQTAKAR